MERARINDVELEYEVAGIGEPVVFIHGAFIADTFRPLLTQPILTSRYQLIVYHRRGYAGSSRVTEPISIPGQATDLRALLGHLGVDRAHIVGHSYGGVVALQLAMDSPDMVHSLALLEPALAVGASAQGYRESLARGVERYREVGAETVVHEFLAARSPGYRETLAHTLPGALDQAVTDAITSFEYELDGLLNWHFAEEAAWRITQPTLSVLGGGSEALSPRFAETHQSLLAWLPNAEGFVLSGATHFLQLDAPQRMAEALVAFWARHSFPVAPDQ